MNKSKKSRTFILNSPDLLRVDFRSIRIRRIREISVQSVGNLERVLRIAVVAGSLFC